MILPILHARWGRFLARLDRIMMSEHQGNDLGHFVYACSAG